MNKLVMTVAATMAFAAFAEESACTAPACTAPACSVAAPAEKPMRPSRPPMMMGGGAMDPIMRAVMNPRVQEKLGLTEEQKAKLAAMRSEKTEDRELQNKARKGMERQIELLKAEKIDEAAVMSAIDEQFEARKEMAKLQAKRTIAIRSILTPEQTAKALEAMKEMRGPRPFRNGPKEPVVQEAAPKVESPVEK